MANYDRKSRQRRPRIVPAWLLLGSLLLLRSVAAAQAAPSDAGLPLAHLEWRHPAASTCITQSALAQRVEALLGRRVFVADKRAALHIAGTVEQRGGGWVATLHIDEPGGGTHGLRELQQEGDDCAALSPALTVVIATLIALAQPDSGAQDGIAVTLGFAGGGAFGLLPEPTAGGSLWLGLTPIAGWSIWLNGSAWLPVDKLDALQRGATFDAWQAGLALCRDLRAAERLVFPVCAGGQFGIIEGVGRGLGPNRSSQRLLVQTNLEAALSLRLVSALALRASATGLLSLNRPSFFLEQPNNVHRMWFRPALFGLSLRAGITLEFR